MKDFPFIKFVVYFVIGILLHPFIKLELWQILLALFLTFIFVITVQNFYLQSLSDKVKPFVVTPLFILFGLLIATNNIKEFKTPLSSYYKEKDSKLYARVLNIELYRSFEIVLNVKVDSIFIKDSLIKCNDELICKFRGDSLQRKILYENLNPGNAIFLSGTFQKGRDRRNPYEFDYNEYLNSKGIAGIFIAYETDTLKIIDKSENIFFSSLFSLKKSIDNIIVSLHDKETANMLRGLILADRSGIDLETKNAFVNSGVVHILAVSGLNVGYVILIFVIVFGRFSIYIRSGLTITGLLIFMFITGATPPVVRATIMGIIIILTFLSNRSTNIFNSLAISAFIILLFYPQQIYDPGFQLSFGAVLSTAIIYPYIETWIESINLKWNWIKKVILFIGVSFSAQIGTIPFTLIYFAKLSVVSILTNLFVIPISGIITAIAFVTIFLGSFSQSITIYFAASNNLLTFIMMEFIRYTGNLEISFLWIRNYTLYDSIVFYSVLTLFIYALSKFEKLLVKIIFSISCFAMLFYYSSFDDAKLLADNKLNILMIDVGQGDSFLIKFPNGKTALIDAGEANPYFDNGEKVITPLLDNLGIDKIDYGFISHLDLDHYGGFVSLIYNDRIKEVYRPLPDSSSKSLRLEKFLQLKKVKTGFYNKSDFNIDNTKLYFLNEPNNIAYSKFSGNDKSGVIKIVYGKTSFLFVGDCEYPAEYFLSNNFRNVLDSDVLKVGHHGSPTASSEIFISLVSPKISLVSSGIKNKFKHPAESVIAALNNINSKVLRTDKLGAVLLQSDGKEIKQIEWKEN